MKRIKGGTEMKTKLRKSLSVIMTAVMLISVFAGMNISFAATSGDFKYSVLSDGTAEITDYTGSAANLTIPSTIEGYTVTSIGDYAFSYCDSLTSVTIPDCVKSIGNSAFYSCQNLVSVSIPDSVTSIGNSAFSYCDSLTSATIPDCVACIGDRTFNSCSNLTSVKIGNSVTKVGDYAFYDCFRLKSIRIPDSVTELGSNVFYGCDSLTSVIIGRGVTSIDKFSFPSSLCNLKTVYYTSTRTQWNNILIRSYNDALINANIIFNYVLNNLTNKKFKYIF